MRQWTTEEEQILRLLIDKQLAGLDILSTVPMGSGQARSLAGLYVVLHRMEQEGLLCSAWGDESPPERGHLPRRYYTATRMGLEALALIDHWRKGERVP